MAVGTGYSSIATNGLIFAYNVADNYNSYRGQPGTNITTGPNRNYSGYNKDVFSNGKLFETNGYTETVNIPALGPVVVQSVEIYNIYSGYGTDGNYNCCPNLFNYTGGWNSAIWSGNTTYTYQIIYRCNTGYTNANYMYHYEYNSSGGYLTEFGVHTTAYEESLGNGWYHAWNTFTTQPTAALGYTGLWYYQYNIPDKVSIAAVSIAQGSTIRPARQLIPSGTTRSNTQGLLSIPRTSNTLDLSNVSFDSNAQMYFDGINDYIDINPSFIPTGNQITVEFVMRNDSSSNNTSIIAGGSGAQDFNIHLPWSDGNVYWDCGSPFNRINKATTSAERTGIHHWVFTKNATTGMMYIYLDGILWHSGGGNTSSIPSLASVSIGRYDNGSYRGYYYNGYTYVAKVYNKELSEGEIRQNYNHYKTKYNLPGIVYNYNERNRADLYTGYWNNSTTYTMTDFGGLGEVTAHGFSSGPVTFTLTLPGLPTHTKVRYKVYWHLVDSLDNETNQLYIMNSSGGETEILRFTKQYNLSPSISIAASPGTYTWSGSKTYSYRPWANGAYNADGYIIVDSGWVDHTASTFTARHVMGADQAQADEAEYLSHVEVQLFG